MASQYQSYQMRDGKTPLAAMYFNPIWQSLDSRLGQLESISEQMDTAIQTMTNAGLARLEEVVLPTAQEAQSLVAQATAALNDALADYTFLINVQAGQADSVALTYAPDGTLSEVEETYAGEVKTIQLSYDVDGKLDEAVTEFNGTRRTETISYDGSDRIDAVTATEEAIPE